MGRILLAAVLAVAIAGPVRAANAPVLAGITSSQVAYRYHRPDTTICTWEVSQNASYSPLVAGLSQTDSGELYGRWFVLGQTAALAADTVHYWRQTCGSEVYTGQFRTLKTPTGTPSDQTHISAGGLPYGNKMRLDYGATPALGSSVTVDCTPHCAVSVPFPFDSILFYRIAYLNESDEIASGSISVSMNR